MNKISSLLAVTLLLSSPFASAESDNAEDLRYCLDLKSDQQIAKCAGEMSPGKKGRPFSKEEVGKILSEVQAGAPGSVSEAPEAPGADTGSPARKQQPGK